MSTSMVGGEVVCRARGSHLYAAVLLLCWLCCWPDDGSSDTSNSRKHQRKSVRESGTHRTGDFFSRRIGSSAISLHLPSTSGLKIPLSAHRSHEEIRSRRKSHHEPTTTTEARYHSAPSVIDEVLHRRDWERSTKDLYIPLKPQNDCKSPQSYPSTSPEAPCAEPESSSIECLKPEEPKCKKHHKNIKSSKGKCKESNKDDIKDTDATEAPNFYIGDAKDNESNNNQIVSDFVEYEKLVEEKNRSIYRAKDAKQSLNESIKKDHPKGSLTAVVEGRIVSGFCMDDIIDGIDRSGAMHHSLESRLSLSRPYPPPSVEAVDYEGGACYLAEAGSVCARAGCVGGVGGVGGAGPAGSLPGEGGWRARHASDGDILAPAQRPESGAFSESDLDIDLEALAREERPPEYHELEVCRPRKRETAI